MAALSALAAVIHRRDTANDPDEDVCVECMAKAVTELAKTKYPIREHIAEGVRRAAKAESPS